MRTWAWSASCSMDVSAAPRICRSRSRPWVARVRNVFRSGPLMMRARSAEEPVRQLVDEVRLRLARLPGAIRLEVYQEFIAVGAKGICARLVPPALGRD